VSEAHPKKPKGTNGIGAPAIQTREGSDWAQPANCQRSSVNAITAGTTCTRTGNCIHLARPSQFSTAPACREPTISTGYTYQTDPKRQPISIPEKPVITGTAHAVWQTLSRFMRYASIRLVTLCVMVVISVFLTIIVANLGGFLDKVVSANIDESIGAMIHGGWLKEVTDEAERDQIIAQTRAAMHEGAGLNSPFLVRCFKWLWKGITLDWGIGRPYSIYDSDFAPEVRDTILDFLPRTLLVFGTANILLFFSSIFIALAYPASMEAGKTGLSRLWPH